MRNKLTFFVSTLSRGGAETVCVNLANELSLAGFDIELMVCNLINAPLKERLSSSITIYNLNVKHSKNALIKIIGYINQRKPDAIITFGYEPSVVTIIANLTLLKKTIVIARNVNTLSKVFKASSSLKTKILNYCLRYFYPHADYHINQSQKMEKDLLKSLKISQSKSVVINNPVARYIEINSSVPRVNADPPYILCVGRLVAQKRFDRAILAFSEVSKYIPNICLHIIGIGPDRDLLFNLVQSLQLEDKIFFLGQQSNMIEHYKNASLTLLTSDYEGFPNVLAESIMLGTPVVSIDCESGPSEIIIDGVNGKLSKKAEDLSNDILEIIHNSPPEFKIKESASRFSNDFIIKKYVEVINHCIGAKK